VNSVLCCVVWCCVVLCCVVLCEEVMRERRLAACPYILNMQRGATVLVTGRHKSYECV